MRLLITADWHLTDNPHDAYRWDVIDYVERKALMEGCSGIAILGDLTHEKDGHRGAFVNKVVNAIERLAANFDVLLLLGNHDYAEREAPFFRFLGKIPNVEFIEYPLLYDYQGTKILMLPHAHDWSDNFKAIKTHGAFANLVFFHQALSGAVSSNGFKLTDGLATGDITINPSALIIGGDIHTPQSVGRWVYVGSPHEINFGDGYGPQAQMMVYHSDKRACLRLDYPSISKISATITEVADLEKLRINPGDQLKIDFKLPRSRFVEWQTLRRDATTWCANHDVRLANVSMSELRTEARSLATPTATTVAKSRSALVAEFGSMVGLEDPTVRVGQEVVA